MGSLGVFSNTVNLSKNVFDYIDNAANSSCILECLLDAVGFFAHLTESGER